MFVLIFFFIPLAGPDSKEIIKSYLSSFNKRVLKALKVNMLDITYLTLEAFV